MARRPAKIGLSERQRLLEHFVAGTPARSAAEPVGVNRKTATPFYRKIRAMIACRLEDDTPFAGEIEVDESYFGGRRKGKRGRGVAGKVPVFGLPKRGGKVYAKVIPDASGKTLMPIIIHKIPPDSIVYSDCPKAYNAIDVTRFRHHRINRSQPFADKKNHINGIENFWNKAKRRLRKYNGIPKQNFPLFLKECAFRFNYAPTKCMSATLKNGLNQKNSDRIIWASPQFNNPATFHLITA